MPGRFSFFNSLVEFRRPCILPYVPILAAEVKFGSFFSCGSASQSAFPKNVSCLSVSLCPRTLLTSA